MKRMPRTWTMGAVGILALTSLAGCVAGGYDGGGGVGVAYVGGVYPPGGYEYGGWGHDYRVGPPRRGGERWADGRTGPPSIPHGGRGGDGKRGDERGH
jgi:hypothetical protein